MEKLKLGYPMENEDGSIDVPLFYGDDPEEWISWVESYGSDESFSDFQMRQFAYGFIEGDALAWYCEETSRSPFGSWEELKVSLLQRFSKGEEIIGTVLKQRDEHDSKMSSIWSCLDRREKFFLETEQLEERNLRDEERDKSSFKCEEIKSGFHEIGKEETLQHEEEKQTKANKGEPACQVFEKMTKRRKKKKRHKRIPHRRHKINHKLEINRNNVKRRINSCNQLCLTLKLYDVRLKVLWITKKQLGKNAYQMFVEMTRLGKKATAKKKKKKKKKKNGQVVMTALMAPERTVKWHGSLVAQLLLEDLNLPLSDYVSNWSSSLLATVSHASKTEDISFAQVVLAAFLISIDRSDKAQKMVMEKGLHLMRDSAKNFSNKKYNVYGRSKGCMKNERVIRKNITSWWNCQVLEVSAGKVNKKPCVKMKMHTHQVFVKMHLRRKIVKEKRRFDSKSNSFKVKGMSLHMEKLLRNKMKNKPRRHKNWTVRESQRLTCCCHKRIISIYQVADKIWPLMLPKEKIKAKRKKKRNDVFFLAKWDNKIHQAFLYALIGRIKTVKEKMLWTSGKRHKISHKHAKEKVILFLTFQRKRAFIEPVFRVKKRTMLKLKKEFTNSNCVLPMVYVKLLWRFITRVKNQFMTRPKFRKKHRKRKRKKKYVENKQQVWKTVFVVEGEMLHFGIQVKWGKLTGKSIAVSAETLSTNLNGGNTLEKVSLVSSCQERGSRPTWVGFLTIYGTTIAVICGRKNGWVWDDCSIEKWLKKPSREDQGMCKVKDKEEKGFARSLTTQIPVERAHTARKS